MKRIGLLVLVGVWAVLGFAQESVVDSVQMDLRTAFERVAALEGFEALSQSDVVVRHQDGLDLSQRESVV